MMTPGVSEHRILGNKPKEHVVVRVIDSDVAWERFHEAIDEDCAKYEIDPVEAARKWQAVIMQQTGSVVCEKEKERRQRAGQSVKVPYVVIPCTTACSGCGCGASWDVVGPDGFVVWNSFTKKVRAEIFCDRLNEAYHSGRYQIPDSPQVFMGGTKTGRFASAVPNRHPIDKNTGRPMYDEAVHAADGCRACIDRILRRQKRGNR